MPTARKQLRYARRRYVTREAAAQVAVAIANATFAPRRESLWGPGSTTVVSDPTHFSSWDQNIFTEWHSRYGGRGILIYWHVERGSMVVHAMVEGAVRHGNTMSVESNYVDSRRTGERDLDLRGGLLGRHHGREPLDPGHQLGPLRERSLVAPLAGGAFGQVNALGDEDSQHRGLADVDKIKPRAAVRQLAMGTVDLAPLLGQLEDRRTLPIEQRVQRHLRSRLGVNQPGPGRPGRASAAPARVPDRGCAPPCAATTHPRPGGAPPASAARP